MKLQNTINIYQTLIQIETFLLDFEQCPKTELLLKILVELKSVSLSFRKYFQLRNINRLINELLAMFTAASEKKLVLKINDTNLALQIVDLLFVACNVEYSNVGDIAVITDNIVQMYCNNIKQVNQNVYFINNSREKTVLFQKTSNDVTSKVANNNSKPPDTKQISDLILILKDTIDIASDNTFRISSQQLNNINQTASYIKEFAVYMLGDDNSASLIAETNKQLDRVNNLTYSYEEF